MRKGFTLVELSIVLVIIGLLTGGILIGKSLIQSAQINRLVSDIRQYEVAIIQFNQKFRQTPGDSNYFTPPGNNNGVADINVDCAASGGGYYDWEEVYVWTHLSQAKMISKDYPAWRPEDCGGPDLYEDIYLNQKYAPYINISDWIAESYGRKTLPLSYAKAAGANPYFVVTMTITGFHAFKKKIGESKYVNMQTVESAELNPNNPSVPKSPIPNDATGFYASNTCVNNAPIRRRVILPGSTPVLEDAWNCPGKDDSNSGAYGRYYIGIN